MMVASWLGASCQFLAAETSLGVSLASLVNLKTTAAQIKIKAKNDSRLGRCSKSFQD
jgi:hypothetical protein